MSLKNQILFLIGVTCSSAFAVVIDGNQDGAIGMGLAMQACQTDLHTPRQQRQQQMHGQDAFPYHQPDGTPQLRPSAIPQDVYPGQQGVPDGYYGTQLPENDYGYPPESEKFPGQP